ncbi:uncharacterized protein EAF01_008171 [Botrytis porri]|uniref:uncharacterized protein n=1 Tax=Botrytis porri TaxID=87229 RepID=UPI001900319F|nr:uncharacterized protein EAF01_008171 [Botrytis porri]KAF7898958.1 hypothetical protein EAF01_008171 [Botrytis porri]
MAPTIVLISGANRGLGKGLLAQYISKPDHIVIAANRDPSHPTSKALSELPTGANTKLFVIKVDGSSPTSAQTAIDTLPSLGIDHLDLVIANAGVSYAWPTVADLKIEDLEGHFIPNVFGAVRLYQATLPLLLKSKDPKWVTIGSTAGMITNQLPIQNQLPIPNGAYGPSKAAIHWFTKRMNVENPPLNAFVLDPGWCQTELGNAGAVYFGMDQAAVSVEDSCALMAPLITKSTKESHGGKLWSYEGGQLEW